MADYLNDVQQLRCLAVVVVILFHLNLCQTGFRGVDIFFVISGFILTNQLIHRPAKSVKSVLSFWLVRSRRIIPAAYLVLVIFVLYFVYIAYVEHPELYLSEFKSAVNFYSNFHYYNIKNDYFHPSSNSVFLNFWSLATEMQYYIFFPLIIVNNYIMLLLFILSFTIYQYYYAIDTSFNYYSMIPRIWEFLFGTIIIKCNFYYDQKQSKNINIIIKYSYFIALFILSFFNTTHILSRLDNLITMLFTSYFISFIPHFLNLYVIEHIGDLSYIIYLIHFPLKFIIVGNYPLYFIILYLSSAVVYYLYEKPILNCLKKMSNLKCAVFMFFLVICCNIFCNVFEMQMIKKNENMLSNIYESNGNIIFKYIPEELNNYCCYKSLKELENKNNIKIHPILFVGDSHALRYIGAIRSYVSYLKQPFYFKYVNTFYIINNIKEYIFDINEYFDVILLSNLYKKNIMGNDDVFVNTISKYILYLLNYCKKLIFFKPTPVLNHLIYCNDQKEFKYGIEPYNITMAHDEYNLIANNDKVITIDFKDFYCQNNICNLTYLIDNEEKCVYYDEHHIDMKFIEYHMNYVIDILKPLYNIQGNFIQKCMYYYYNNTMYIKWNLEDKECTIIYLKDVY